MSKRKSEENSAAAEKFPRFHPYLFCKGARVAIIGRSCSGKTTLADFIGPPNNMPVHDGCNDNDRVDANSISIYQSPPSFAVRKDVDLFMFTSPLNERTRMFPSNVVQQSQYPPPGKYWVLVYNPNLSEPWWLIVNDD